LWRAPSVIVFDEAIYPIARWSLDRAAVKGARLLPFRHLDPQALRAVLQHAAPHRAPPWLIADGICAGCGRPAPLAAYLEALRPLGGTLVIDDAQAIGLYGREATSAAPYGEGGGGSLARAGVAEAPDAIVVASMAKAFGAPLAFMAGAAPFIERASGACETLFHCSPPCEPVVRAARAALAANARGDLARRRRRLGQRVRAFREALEERGLVVRGGSFPMQRVPMPDLATALAVQRRLLARGVRAVVRHVRCIDEVSLTFVVTALHDEGQLDFAAQALAAAYVPRRPARSSPFFASSSSRPSGAAFPSSNVEA
jgi:8-amino-7-oxononanoate synthase